MKITGRIWKFAQDDINTGLIRKQMLFMSNCVSGGLWPIACPDIVSLVETGERIEIDTDTAEIRNLDTGRTTRGVPLPDLYRDMAAAGGEKPYLKARLARDRANETGANG